MWPYLILVPRLLFNNFQIKMKKKKECKQCGDKTRTLHLWRSNHQLAKGVRWVCETCFRDKSSMNAWDLLSLYIRAIREGCKKEIYHSFQKAFDNSSTLEQRIFTGLIAQGYANK